MIYLNIRSLSIPVDPVVFYYSAVFLYRRYSVMALLDRYPESLKDTIEKTRDFINQNRLAPPFDYHPDWMIKTSSSHQIVDDLSDFFKFGLGNSDFNANNQYGTIYRISRSIPLRVNEAKKLRRIIKINRLDLLEVPKKYCCSHLKKKSNLYFFVNKLYFAVAKKYKTASIKKEMVAKTKSILKSLSKEEAKQLTTELILFLRHSGVLDFHLGNVYIENRKFIYFDTEPMALTLLSRIFSISVPLKEAKVNYKNAMLIFRDTKKELTRPFKREIKKIEAQERNILIHQISFIALALLHILTLF